jgi:hypothetical protein
MCIMSGMASIISKINWQIVSTADNAVLTGASRLRLLRPRLPRGNLEGFYSEGCYRAGFRAFIPVMERKLGCAAS